ncbi:ABC transporter permease [Aestuariivita sp.]|jgi:ABC-2 type transport system permease protein|uniref:ABC transporter permease n=1 Tax=Aestuariivita sp. TaxID=1872407 RepID=UPI002170A6DA|nr:ABC transporter permease [Aestuariivita sp.]MCE8006872.1 ABC transporter permease [Aestuariivita sp.]
MRWLSTVFWLGTKELRSVLRDTVMAIFILWSFTLGVSMKAQSSGETVNNASVAIVDQDRSALSARIDTALYPPYFQMPDHIAVSDMDTLMDEGAYMFVIVIPPRFAADLIAGRGAAVQVNADATAVSQASLGVGYIQSIINEEVARYLDAPDQPAVVDLVLRRSFNEAGIAAWFGSLVSLLDQLTMLVIILTGAALLREREHGTIEHLMVMPLSSLQIAMAKIWANGLVILVCFSASLVLIVQAWMEVPVAGSLGLLGLGTVIYLFAASAIGVFLGTVARSMAQFALLMIITIFPMQMLSGGMSPVQSQPDFIQPFSWLLPSRHYIEFGQAIAFRGAGFDVVWPEFLVIAGLGTIFLAASLLLFRRSLSAGG